MADPASAPELQPDLYWAVPVGERVREIFSGKTTVVERTERDFFAIGQDRPWEHSDFRVVSPRLEPPLDDPTTTHPCELSTAPGAHRLRLIRDLRTAAKQSDNEFCPWVASVMREAADELERLHAENAEQRDYIRNLQAALGIKIDD